jgi:hypothetical protein
MKIKVVSALLLALSSFSSAAALINTELPDNAYITINGYDVAWISPWSQHNTPGGIDFSFQSLFGWAPMTLDIYNNIGGLTGYNFAFAGANVDYVSGNNLDEASGARLAYVQSGTAPQFDVAVATPWFTNHTWIDWSQGTDGQWSLANFDFHGCTNSCNESLAFRVSQTAIAQVPEPATLAILGLGLIGIAARRRRS